MQRGVIVIDPNPGWATPLYSDLLPGAHVVVVGRESDGIEARRAGFEVRDTILVVGEGLRTALLLRRPIEAQTVVEQVMATGTGAMWIDGCRVGTGETTAINNYTSVGAHGCMTHPGRSTHEGEGYKSQTTTGRWPTNIVFVYRRACHRDGPTWGCAADCDIATLDRQSGILKSGVVSAHHMRNSSKTPSNGGYNGHFGDTPLTGYGDEGGASRFFPQSGGRDDLLAWFERLLLGAPGPSATV